MEGIIAYFCLLWFIVQTKSVSLSEIHHALLAVVAFADGLGRGVHDCVARAVAAVVVDDAAGLEVRIDRDKLQ